MKNSTPAWQPVSTADAAPTFLLPADTQIFARRAERFERLAGQRQSLSGYLRLLGELARAQQQVFDQMDKPPLPTTERLKAARAQGMPPLGYATLLQDQAWQAPLQYLLKLLSGAEMRAAARSMLEILAGSPAQTLDEWATALLKGELPAAQAGHAPFLMAALQVYWTALARQMDVTSLRPLDVPDLCPCCGSLAVASRVRVGGVVQGSRYLYCALCASEWHLPRIRCVHCGETRDIAYYGIEGEKEAILGETCRNCMSYHKLMDMEKDTGMDAIADDIASIGLDLLLAQAGWHRQAANPFLLADNG